MANVWASLVFLIGVYWPYLLAASCVGVVTGWMSLSRPGQGGDEL